MDITDPYTQGRAPQDIARRLYEALDALMDELGPPDTWDGDVELIFRRKTLERALLALDEADSHGLGAEVAPDTAPRFLRALSRA